MATRSLEFLDLGSNDLTEVPSWVLKQPLKYLSLGANLLSDVPDLDHLPLETLKLHKNRLTRLPKLGTGIVSLNLFLNDIQDFPEAVLGMQKLEFFTFGLSRLRFLPSLASLANLRWLTLTVCDIEYLPDDIHMLTNLEGLQLAKNRLKCLPNRIGELSVLKNLTLYSNEITRLPYSFYELKLNKLNVSSNPLLQEDKLRVWRTFGNIDFIRV
jgi:Leucine-rich repeat (LRR) protein